jgi:peptidoglycan/LPS O-acetylase OafA/YrhL
MYHLPIFLLIDHFRLTRLPQPSSFGVRLGLDVVKVGLTYAVALASWILLENPLRRLKDRIAPTNGASSASAESS